jgi:hypothetical protein
VGLPVAGLPVLRLLAAVPVGLLVAGGPAAEWPVPELPGTADATDVAGAAGVADVVVAVVAVDPPEVRSWPGPVPAAVAVGCSAVAGGRASVEVDLSVCVGF